MDLNSIYYTYLTHHHLPILARLNLPPNYTPSDVVLWGRGELSEPSVLIMQNAPPPFSAAFGGPLI